MARILVLCSRLPYPLTGGAKLRMYHTARLLASEHEVDLLVVDEEPVDDANVTALEDTFENVRVFTYPGWRFYLNTVPGLVSARPLQTHYFSFGSVDAWLDKHAERYDLLYCNHVRTTEYARGREIPKVVDLVDAISRNYAESGRDAEGLWRAIYPLEAKRLRRYERQIIDEFDHSFVITEADRTYIIDGESQPAFDVLPNGVREEILERGPATDTDIDDPLLVFLGKMDYFPNEDAALYFAKEIFPSVREVFPEATFRIVGASPAERVRQLDELPGVSVTGFVDDPIDYLEAAHVIVAPMRHGAGLQNKVLEGMGLGKPLVTTPLGREGIMAEEGEHLLVSDSADGFATAVIELLEDEDRRFELGLNARQLVTEKYTWERVKPILLDGVETALENM